MQNQKTVNTDLRKTGIKVLIIEPEKETNILVDAEKIREFNEDMEDRFAAGYSPFMCDEDMDKARLRYLKIRQKRLEQKLKQKIK